MIMTATEALITDAGVFMASVGVALYCIKRWIDRIERKVDSLHDQRVQWVTREEFTASVSRIHERLDTMCMECRTRS